MKKQIADWTLYKWRYILGYGSLIVLLLLAVTSAAIYAPGGITQSEIDSIAITNQLAEGNFAVVNLPFHLLQLAGFKIFGVSILTIKLPSIILSIISAVAMFFLLRRWFKPNIAILSMLIMAVTGQFIFIAQNATPHILYVLYTALILLFATLVFQKAKRKLLWKALLAVTVGLSLYTPYFLYILVGLIIGALIHPHTRHSLVKPKQRKNWLIAFAALLIIVAPLIYLCYSSDLLLTSIIGHEALEINVVENLKIIFKTYFWTEPIVAFGQILPIMDFSTLALIILGTLSLFRQRYTARAYMIAIWMIIAIPLLALRPHLTIIITIPLFILLAIGVETLLSEWYKLFPKNPYARTAGLLFIITLISVMIFSGIDRFVHGYRHMPQAAREFSSDISLVNHQLSKKPAKTNLIVDEKELPLYQAMAKNNKLEIDVMTDVNNLSSANVIVTRAAKSLVPQKGWQNQQIITNSWTENGDRLYLYKVDPNKL